MQMPSDFSNSNFLDKIKDGTKRSLTDKSKQLFNNQMPSTAQNSGHDQTIESSSTSHNRNHLNLSPKQKQIKGDDHEYLERADPFDALEENKMESN